MIKQISNNLLTSIIINAVKELRTRPIKEHKEAAYNKNITKKIHNYTTLVW